MEEVHTIYERNKQRAFSAGQAECLCEGRQVDRGNDVAKPPEEDGSCEPVEGCDPKESQRNPLPLHGPAVRFSANGNSLADENEGNAARKAVEESLSV